MKYFVRNRLKFLDKLRYLFINSNESRRPFTLVLLTNDMRTDSYWLENLKLIEANIIKQIIEFNIYKGSKFEFVRSKSLYKFHYKNRIHLLLIMLLIMFFISYRRNHVIHAHGQIAAVMSITIKLFRRIPVIIDRHHGHQNYVKGNRRGIFFDKYTSLLASRVLVHSEQALQSLHLLEPWTKNKSALVMLPIDVDRFSKKAQPLRQDLRRQFNISDNTFIVGTNARAESWKGLSTVISAFEAFHSKVPNSILIMLNVSSHDEEYEKIIRTTVNLPVVIEKNYTPIEDFYHALDVFCHTPTSLDSEAAGLVYLEALAAQVPSIFTRSGVVAKFEKSQDNLYLINYMNDFECFQGMLYFNSKKKCGEKSLFKYDMTQLKLSNFFSVMIAQYIEVSRAESNGN